MKIIVPAMALLAVAFIATPARAQSSAEQAGQQACGNDVFAMCGDAIPDRGRIEACLRRNFSRVSPTCKHYMANYGRTHHARRAARGYTRHHRVVRRHHYVRHRPTHHIVRRHHTRHHRR